MLACDTSFLISVFLEDQNHVRARTLLTAAAAPILLSPLNLLEFQTSIRRLIGSKDLDEGKGLKVIEEFEALVQAGGFEAVTLPDALVWERAFHLARSYASELLVRSLDVWQVAFALEMKAKTFWSFDERQRKLAKAVGLEVNQ